MSRQTATRNMPARCPHSFQCHRPVSAPQASANCSARAASRCHPQTGSPPCRRPWSQSACLRTAACSRWQDRQSPDRPEPPARVRPRCSAAPHAPARRSHPVRTRPPPRSGSRLELQKPPRPLSPPCSPSNCLSWSPPFRSATQPLVPVATNISADLGHHSPLKGLAEISPPGLFLRLGQQRPRPLPYPFHHLGIVG